MSNVRVGVQARAVASDELRSWPLQAWQLWRRVWVRLAFGAFCCGLLLQALDPFIGFIVMFLIGPSVLWALVVTAQPELGPDAGGQRRLLPVWLPGVIRIAPLGLIVGGVAGCALFAAALLAAVALVLAGHPPGSVEFSGAPSAFLPGPLLLLWKACGWGALTIVVGMVSLAYVGVFGLYLGASSAMSVWAARTEGVRAWKLSEPALRAWWEGLGRRGQAVLAVIAALLLLALVSEAFDPFALVVATFVPCLLAVAYSSVFPGDRNGAGQGFATKLEAVERRSQG